MILLEHQCFCQILTLIKVDFHPAQKNTKLPLPFWPNKRFHSCFRPSQIVSGNFSCFYIIGAFLLFLHCKIWIIKVGVFCKKTWKFMRNWQFFMFQFPSFENTEDKSGCILQEKPGGSREIGNCSCFDMKGLF